jgi:uncharacterized protein (UPF0305 family)
MELRKGDENTRKADILMAEKNLRIFNEIADIIEKSELANVLSMELTKFSIYDIMKISSGLDREISLLPSPYREKSRPYFIEQLFGRYTKIMAMRSNGDFHGLRERIVYLSLYREFCNTESRHIEAICDNENNKDAVHGPFSSLYYMLISCFYMFVLGEPGHPVGTPFPGGFVVMQCGNSFYCPIREKEKDVVYSICNFCPSQQDEDNRCKKW